MNTGLRGTTCLRYSIKIDVVAEGTVFRNHAVCQVKSFYFTRFVYTYICMQGGPGKYIFLLDSRAKY